MTQIKPAIAEVVSVACKNGNIPKEDIGLADRGKIRPGQFEALRNPVAALQLADSYYRVWGPDKPAKPARLPPAGRRS